MERQTKQKQVILDYLASVDSHPSAEEVYKAVKKKMPEIGKATVYRVLKSFKDKGEVLELGEGTSCYDADVSQHEHFICNCCGRMFDALTYPCQTKMKKTKTVKYKRNYKTEEGEMTGYRLYIYGICKKCKKANK